MEAINNGADFYLIRAGDPKNEFIALSHKIKRAVEQRQAEVDLKNQKNVSGHSSIPFPPGSWLSMQRLTL